ALVVTLWESVPLPAQTVPLAARFTATTTNFQSREPLRFDVLRWSTDTDRDQVMAALAKSDDDFLKALGAAPTVGYLWSAGALGYSLHYAYRVAAPDGSERIVL